MAQAHNRTISFERKLLKIAFECGKWAGAGIALIVSYLNVQPYLGLVLWIAPEQGAVTDFLISIPLVGWLITGAGWLFTIVVAIVLWATIQVIQVMPDLLKNDQENVKFTIDTYRRNSGGTLSSSDNDPSVIQALVRIYNNLPAAWIKTLFRSQKTAWLIDFCLSAFYYYPLKVDYRIFWIAKDPAMVDWINVLIIVACVFTANILLHLITVIEQGSRYIKLESTHE
ncbi:MAG: hypothetical protein ACO3YZ_05190 [Candidatus Nanopelagicaceae bacterium]